MSALDQFRDILPKIDSATLSQDDRLSLIELLRGSFEAAEQRTAERRA